MRIAFLGTPDFASIPLRCLANAQHDVVLVVTQPDKRRGRGKTLVPSPVKTTAAELGIPVSYILDDLIDVEVDFAVVAAFGKIIPARVLDAHTFINIHPSLLPRWRGAAPVDHTILAGDITTGVCLIRLEQEMDAGPIYRVTETAVGEHEHARELLPRLFELGSDLLVEALETGLGEPVPQTGEPTFASKFDVDDTLLDWNKPAIDLDRAIRTDRAWTWFRDKRLRILDSRLLDVEITPGELEGAVAGTGNQSLELLRVQPEGRQAMTGSEWVNGARVEPGERLG